MNSLQIKDERPRFKENDPPLDLTRANAAFERERLSLVRDHLGKIALIHMDEIVGAYATLGEAMNEGFRRFGDARLIFRPITARDEEEWVSNVDIHHPAVRRVD